MVAASISSTPLTITLTADERDHLLTLLEQVLRDKEIEVHRTEAFAARQVVQHQQAILEGVIGKLRQS